MVSQAMGLMRTCDYDPEAQLDIVPADAAINALIAIAMKTATERHCANGPPKIASKSLWDAIPVYNISEKCASKNGDMFKLNLQILSNNLIGRAIRPMASFAEKPGRLCYYFRKYYDEYFLFAIYSGMLSLFGLQPMRKTLLQIYTEMNAARFTLEKVTLRNAIVCNGNFKMLENYIAPRDREIFPIAFEIVDKHNFIEVYDKAIKMYRKQRLNEGERDLLIARRRQWLLYAVEFALHLAAIAGVTFVPVWIYRLIKRQLRLRK